jgi:hypothetical protein
MVMNNVHNIIHNAKRSGSHSNDDEKYNEIRNNFVNGAGKNIQIAMFYAYMLLEEIEVRFISRRLIMTFLAQASICLIC